MNAPLSQFPIPSSTPIRIAMLGMVEGNGHPYSWSAIFNGYDPEAMATCPYPVIPEYLAKQPPETFGIPGAHVTHVWTDDPAEAKHVAKCSRIPHVVSSPTDVIGKVDAVIIATDIGREHVARCRPFIEAGLPVFVDKPMVDDLDDLRVFCNWAAHGKAILSSSALRYAKEFMPWRASTADLGRLRYVSITTPKSWERYGIHALEGMYPIVGPGFVNVRNTGSTDRNIVHLQHERGVDVVVAAIADMTGGFGLLTLGGASASIQVQVHDTFFAFKRQLEDFVRFLRTGKRPFPFAETVELMLLVIAGIRSREAGGAVVRIADLRRELEVQI